MLNSEKENLPKNTLVKQLPLYNWEKKKKVIYAIFKEQMTIRHSMNFSYG